MLDRHSEIIAHFIGAFQQTTEQLSARQQYDTFRAMQLGETQQGPLLNVTVHMSSDYALGGFSPELSLKLEGLPPREAPQLIHEIALSTPRGMALPVTTPLQPLYLAPFLGASAGVASGTTQYQVVLDAPSSFATYTFQSNVLHDGDVIDMVPFELPEAFEGGFSQAAITGKLDALSDLADGLSLGGGGISNLSIADQVQVVSDAIEALDGASGPDGADVVLYRKTSSGPDPQPEESKSAEVPPTEAPAPDAFSGAVVMDGVFTDAVPTTLADRLEARNPPQDEEPELLPGQVRVEGESVAESSAAGRVETPATPHTNIPEITQSLETGDNLLLNQAQVSHNWLDAPVIAAAGSAHSLSVISQTNVIRDHDIGAGGKTLHAGSSDPASAGHNIATQTTSSNPVDFLAPRLADGDTMIGLVRITGDMVIDNTTVQVNQVHDSDIVSYSFGWHQTEISTGGNTAVNLETLLQLGGRFDVILVGGNLMQLTMIEQINVLLDDDLFLGGGGGAHSTHDNLAWNEAQISRVGTDTATEMSDHFQSALKALGDLSKLGGGHVPSSAEFAAAAKLLGDPLMSGLDSLRVLYVEGDLMIRDTLTQINILSDSDVVSVALPGDDAMPTVSTGGNTLVNVAALTVNGVDSAVMAGAGSYSDAVLYQAGMLDMEGDSFKMAGGTSALKGDLASEAVVFLTDDGPFGPDAFDEETHFIPDAGNSGTLDALHSVLA
ncbi:hypothetical protein FGG78_17265 [Thioclava sp. BHET1]|nr:hypothetical protein FGG78_17265 [Thioclava sp. BHET1]